MSGLLFIRYRELENWSVKSYLNSNLLQSQFELVSLGKLIKIRQEKIKKDDYKNDIDLVKKISFKDGKIYLREERKTGMDLYNVYPNDLLVSKINFQGALSINEYSNNLLSSTHYQPYIVNKNKVDLKFLTLALRSKQFQNAMAVIKSEGIKTEATSDFIKSLKIPLPSLKTQQEIVKNYQSKLDMAKEQNQLAKQKEAEIETYLYQELGIELPKEENQENKPLLQFVRFKDLNRWSVKDLLSNNVCSSKLYKTSKISNIITEKPKYGSNSRGIKIITDIRYIRITDINEDGSLNNAVVSAEIVNENYILSQDDFLIARSGNTVGKTFLYDKKYGKCLYAGYLIKFVLNKTLVNPSYLLIFSKSKMYKKWIASNLRAAGQPNINSQEYLESPIILPPLKIQTKIANHIQTIKDEIKSLKQQAEQNQKDALNEFEQEVFNET